MKNTKKANGRAEPKKLKTEKQPTLHICELTEDGVNEIFKGVRRVGYGAFLTSFARAYLCANNEDRDLMYPVALAIIGKYGLNPMGPCAFDVNE